MFPFVMLAKLHDRRRLIVNMMKNIGIGALSLAVVVLLWIVLGAKSAESSVKSSHTAMALSATGDITCTYPQVLHVAYQAGEISHELPKPETNPIIMTFSDIGEKVATIKFLDATQSISEVPAVKVSGTADKLIFLEGSGDPYITVHTIFKDTGVSIYAKQMSLLGTPIGSIAMGTCVDY